MKYCNLLLTIASLCGGTHALATTYYVDAKNGNDSLSGKTSTVSGTNGPWQSIAKVNSAALQPGDQVLFSCGQTWSETLKPSTNGTTTAKIYFGTNPAQCLNKPKITGFQPVLSHNWQPHKGNIWKTTFPQNLIVNGILSSSVTNWGKYPSDASLAFNSLCPLSVAGCMNFTASSTTASSLAISNPFPVIGGQQYSVKLSFYAPTGASIALAVRENGNSYSPVGLNKGGITGNGQWQTITVPFTATRTLSNARLDIQVPKAKNIHVRYAQVQASALLSKPAMVMVNGIPVTVAHHPNAAHEATRPDSVFLLTTAPSPSVKDANGRTVSNRIMVGDLKLPSGGSIKPNTKLVLRDQDYLLHEFSATQDNTNSISLKPNTSYPLTNAGWGYYFYDDLWMLDSAGEWFFDSSTQTLYMQAPNNANPGSSVSVAALDTAIDLSARTNISVENLEIDGAATGANISGSSDVSLRYLNIHNIKNHAIVSTKRAYNPTIASNTIKRASIGGIQAYSTLNAQILNNNISEIGVVYQSGKQVSLPSPSDSAIWGGSGSDIHENYLADIGTWGIITPDNNDVDSNVIERACNTLNDCSAIYAYSLSAGTVIRNNLVWGVRGNLDGIPSSHGEHLIGIYLDLGISGIKVTGNTVIGATHSIQLHDSSNSLISDNTLYGSKRYLLYMNEDTKLKRTAGDIFQNTLSNNKFFSTSEEPPVRSTSLIGDVFDFATYSTNHYSTISWKSVAFETSPNFSQENSFIEWQKAKTTAGVPRNNDIDGGNPAPLPTIAQGTVGNNFMTNGNFSAGLQNWGRYNSTAPTAAMTLEGCLPISVNCLRVINAGGSNTMVYSPKFSVTKDKLYRITVDLKGSANGTNLTAKVRFGGPTNFDHLLTSAQKFTTSTEWKRYSFIFKATDTASNPTINDQGARFDMEGLPSGQTLWVANLEIAPFDTGVSGPARSDIIVNRLGTVVAADCPTRTTNPGLCSNYVTFPEGGTAAWPISIPPRSGKIVFTQNLSLLDSDGDGIANSQDQCTSTVKGLTANTKGCSLSD
jgi:parallel beta-helix repeat protein